MRLTSKVVSRVAGHLPQPLVDFLYRHRFNPVIRGLRKVGADGLGDTEHGVEITRGPLRGYRFAFSDSMAMWIGGHETLVTQEILRQLKPGMTTYDIGAHVGYTVLLMAHMVGPQGLVVGFEPDPENRVLLERNISINGLEAFVKINEAALGESSGRGDLQRGDLSILTQVATSDDGEVAISTLDEQVYSLGLQPPDLIVVDAEGAEGAIFRGGSRLLTERGPKVICEDHGRRDELIELMTGFGYSERNIDIDHVLFERPGTGARA